MDTNLKKSKLIRAFIYRIILVASLITVVASGIFGREALVNLTREGSGTLTGDVYYLTEMREYMATMFHNYMIGKVGVADDLGYPLTDENANQYEQECKEAFEYAIKYSGGNVLYQYQELYAPTSSKVVAQEGNIDAPLYSENDGHLLENGDFELVVYWDGPNSQLRFFDKTYLVPSPGQEYLSETGYSPAWDAASQVRFVLGYKYHDIYLYDQADDLVATAEGYRTILILFFASATLLFISAILSAFTCRSYRSAIVGFRSFSSRILLEVKLLLLAGMVFTYLFFHLNYTAAPLDYRLEIYPDLWLYYPISVLGYLLWIDLSPGLTQCLKNSIIYKTATLLKSWRTAIPWKKKLQKICIILLLSSITTALAIYFFFFIWGGFTALYIGIALLILLISQYIAVGRLYGFLQDTDAILGKIDALSQGTPTGQVTLGKKTLLSHSASALAELENGIEIAVEQQNKANRMRVELITNVSHDLKTPLTSIINYADLLSEEPLDAPASEYVTALREKAYRLKKMVQDVFELSKATTGNLPVENSKLDLAKLVKQTLGDMDEELQKSNLTFKLTISDEPLYIMADGEKMYRVFQNLLVNAMQYSLPGSRVHIQLTEEHQYAVARVKNVSLEEMNFDPEEIIERFVRADSSRTKEGSGLGLSIVQSFTQACGGEFSISLDADLFTACIRFPLISEEEGITDAETTEEI